MRTHLAIFCADRGDVAVLKTHVVKSPNLMGWLYWRFAAINVENRGNGHTWRLPTNLASQIDIANRGDRRIKSPSVSLALSTLLIGDPLVPLITDAANSSFALLRLFLSSVEVEKDAIDYAITEFSYSFSEKYFQRLYHNCTRTPVNFPALQLDAKIKLA